MLMVFFAIVAGSLSGIDVTEKEVDYRLFCFFWRFERLAVIPRLTLGLNLVFFSWFFSCFFLYFFLETIGLPPATGHYHGEE